MSPGEMIPDSESANLQVSDKAKNDLEEKKPYKKKNKGFLLTETIGDAIIPKKQRKTVIHYLERASIPEVPYHGFGLAVYCLIILSIGIDLFFLTTRYAYNFNIIAKVVFSIIFIPIIFFLLLAIATFSYKLYLDAKIFYKTKKMEDVFPEFLSELSLNLKAGQGLEEALENSTEKEFGYLTEEIGRVCKKIRLGHDTDAAIKEFTNSFDSDVIEETFDLITTSWKKGAQTAQLVSRVYDNLQVTRYLKKKVVASVASYRIFLGVVTIIIAPAMFALSYHLIDLIKTMLAKITDVTTNVVLPIALSEVRLNNEHFIWFSALALMIIAVTTAMIVSIIKNGSIKEGYKQMIFYAVATILSYRIFMYLFSYFFQMFNV
ncbi:type II secretion system F family protein [Candidatus Woesearchaeota archaeon]|nr:type II secretion system F family protein [Candidatus Woesearchaeota archaeon]